MDHAIERQVEDGNDQNALKVINRPLWLARAIMEAQERSRPENIEHLAEELEAEDD